MTCSFNSKKNKYGYFRGDEYIKSLCEKFEELALEIIKYKEEKMIPLTDDENKFYKQEEVCHICRKHFCTKKKIIVKSEIIVILQENLEELHIIFVI